MSLSKAVSHFAPQTLAYPPSPAPPYVLLGTECSVCFYLTSPDWRLRLVLFCILRLGRFLLLSDL